MLAFALHGWRSWKSAKSVAALAVLALSIGVGSATAIFSVVNAVLLRPVPWPNGDRYVALFSTRISDSSKYSWSSMSLPDLQDFEQQTRSFDSFGAYMLRDFSLTAPGEPQHLKGVEVSPGFAASLGVGPGVGRWFSDADTAQSGFNLAVISNALWDRLGHSPGILGQTLTIDGKPYTVTGVMPPWFRLPVSSIGGGEYRTDIWVPLHPEGAAKTRDYAPYLSYARLRPGVSLAQANADVKRVAAELAKEFPVRRAESTAVVVGLVDSVTKDFRAALLLLFGAAAVLLLITCANVAGLLLARSVTRARETAIRVALGASSWQLAMQYFAEGLLVALVGAAGAIGIAAVLVRIFLTLAADFIPRADGIGIDPAAALFAFGAAIVCCVLFCLAPLWQAWRIRPNEALSDGARGSAPARSRRLSRVLVAAEIAMAFTLLSGCALLLGHLNRLLSTSPGFDADGLVTFSLSGQADAKKQTIYQNQLLQAIQAIPGVRSAAVVDHLPLEGCCFEGRLFVEGRPRDGDALNLIAISPGYFDTMHIPLLRGRPFNDSDDGKGDVLGVIIDSSAASLLWPGRDALGAVARIGDPNGSRVRVIGIVRSVLNRGLGDEVESQLYVPGAVLRMNPMQFVVRSPRPVSALAPEIRRTVASVDSSQPVYELKPMREVVTGSVTTERVQSSLTALFAFAALLMAALGVYGVVAYSVRHRTVEIGTRMALGAVSRDVIGLVLGDGLKMAALGIAAGAVAVAAMAMLLKSEVYGVRIDEPWPFLYSIGIVGVFTAGACFFPGWRATLVSPMVAIRDDAGSLRESARVFAKRVSNLLAGSDDAKTVSEGELMEEVVDASRRAASFAEAVGSALEALRQAVRCESIVLLQRSDDGNFRGEVPASGKSLIVPAQGVLAWPAAMVSASVAADARRFGCMEPVGGRGQARALAGDRLSS